MALTYNSVSAVEALRQEIYLDALNNITLSTSRSLADTDGGKHLLFSGSSAITITLSGTPKQNLWARISNAGTANITLSGASTLKGYNTIQPGESVVVFHRGSNVWQAENAERVKGLADTATTKNDTQDLAIAAAQEKLNALYLTEQAANFDHGAWAVYRDYTATVSGYAFPHIFPDVEFDTIDIRLKIEDDDTVDLTIMDSGLNVLYSGSAALTGQSDGTSTEAFHRFTLDSPFTEGAGTFWIGLKSRNGARISYGGTTAGGDTQPDSGVQRYRYYPALGATAWEAVAYSSAYIWNFKTYDSRINGVAAKFANTDASIQTLNAVSDNLLPSLLPDSVKLASNGTRGGASTHSSTFSGWKAPFTVPSGGLIFDVVKIYAGLETLDNLLELVIERVTGTGPVTFETLATKQKTVNVNGEQYFKLDSVVSVDAGDIIYVGIRSPDGATRVEQGTGSFDPQTPPDLEVYRVYYTTTGSPSTWQQVSSAAGSATRSTYFTFWNFEDLQPLDVDADTSAITAKVDDVAQYGKWHLKTWLTQLARVENNVSGEQANIVFLGDSWTNTPYRIFEPIRAKLQSLFTNAGTGYISAYSGHTVPSGTSRTITGTWTTRDYPTLAYGVDAADATSSTIGDKITFVSNPVETFIIHFLKKSGGGTFRWRVNAGSWTTVDTSNASNLFGSTTISGLTKGSNTLEVEVLDPSSNGVTLLGVEAKNADVGVRCHKLGNGGITAAGYTALDATIFQAAMTSLSPDIVVICLGTNDHAADVAPATFKASVETIISRIRTAAPLADILLLAASGNNTSGTVYAMPDYAAVMQASARENNYAFVDLNKYLGTYSEANSRGLFEDDVHPNTEGGYVIGKAVLEALLWQN